jgi:hypothetical protein
MEPSRPETMITRRRIAPCRTSNIPSQAERRAGDIRHGGSFGTLLAEGMRKVCPDYWQVFHTGTISP